MKQLSVLIAFLSVVSFARAEYPELILLDGECFDKTSTVECTSDSGGFVGSDRSSAHATAQCYFQVDIVNQRLSTSRSVRVISKFELRDHWNQFEPIGWVPLAGALIHWGFEEIQEGFLESDANDKAYNEMLSKLEIVHQLSCAQK